MVDIALSSNYEEHKLLPMYNLNYMMNQSWRSLSEIISRGIKIINKYNETCRVVGLSKEGELEVLVENSILAIDSLEDLRWEYS